MTEQIFDVAIIGGGAAGLTAAVTLGRAHRSVVVIDSGAPRNAPSDGVHMLLTRDGIRPPDLVEIGRREARTYGAQFIDGEAVAARRVGGRFTVAMADGRPVVAGRLLITTGLIDELPNIPGLRELWGKDVHHCPYCHGWELDGHAVGVIGVGPMSAHHALLFRQWVSDLVYFVNTGPDLTPEQIEQFAALGIHVVTGPVAALEIADGHLTGVRTADGAVMARRSVVIGSRMVARSGVLTSLGLEATQHPMGVGEFLESDAMGLTAVPGVWVAGNVTDLQASVVVAAAQGMMAAVAINSEMIADDTARAVAAYRSRACEVVGSV